MTDLPLLLIAAFGAGILNTIAGGGTFLTFPALVFAGIPPVAANATSAVAVFPGYLSGALAYRRELAGFRKRELARLIAITLLGGLAGSLLLLVSSNEAFSAIVPFLLLAATLTFLHGDRLRDWAARHRGGVTPQGALGLFLVSVYGGY
uniref:sulfite exporter TauE/SafE family protein n=1 Tax=Amaricoccus sp. TaxID=1872485 RepID=UPI00263586DA